MILLLILLSSFIAFKFSRNLTRILIVNYPDYSMDEKYINMIKLLAIAFNILVQYKFYKLFTNLNLYDKSVIIFIWVLICHLLLSLMSGCLASSFMIDCLFQELPDETNLLIGLFLLPSILTIYGLKTIPTGIILFTMFFIMALLTGQLGMGDVKIMLFMGIGFKMQSILTFLFISFMLGSIYGIIKIIITKCGKNQMFAFGPFLIIGFLAVI